MGTTPQIARVIRDSLRVGLLLSVPALIAWGTGKPFIFPSLGPSAFSLILGRREENTARRVIGGHLVGVAGGVLTFHLIARGLSLTTIPASLSPSLLSVAASGVISVVLTTAGMALLRMEHPPACATTMIISLGLLPTWLDALLIMLAIDIMYGVECALDLLRKKSRER